MEILDLIHISNANAGHFIVEVKPCTEDGKLSTVTEQLPVNAWGFIRDKNHDEYGRPLPITVDGIRESASPQLLPNGNVFVPYGGPAGEHLTFENLKAWEAYEKPRVKEAAMLCISKREAKNEHSK